MDESLNFASSIICCIKARLNQCSIKGFLRDVRLSLMNNKKNWLYGLLTASSVAEMMMSYSAADSHWL